MIWHRYISRLAAPLFTATLILSLLSSVELSHASETAPAIQGNNDPSPQTDIYLGTEGVISGPPAPALSYPDSYGGGGRIDSRSVLWIFIQQHFFLGSFILGVPMIAWMLELFGLFRKKKGAPAEKHDQLGRDIMEICLPFYPLTVLTGVALFGAFIFLYSAFTKYMASVFNPVIYLYIVVFFLETPLLYAYTWTWNRWKQGRLKRLHFGLGGLTCLNGLAIIYLANALMAFMMSPSGINAKGAYLGNIWNAVNTPLWNPLNVHRILASIMFSGAVLAAYAAYQMLTTRDPEKKAHYDWMGHIMIMISIANLFILPVAGYWFAKAIFIYRQRMGVTLMGGKLSWPFVMQAMLIGLIFMTVTYYLWQGTTRMHGSERYRHLAKYMMIVFTIAFMIWTTPHTLPASQGEIQAMGGAQHPIVGYYGTMAAKNTAINTMILSFGICFIIFKRCNKQMTISWSRWGNTAMITMFAIAEGFIIYYGVYGFFVPANIRVRLALPQFLVTMGALVVGAVLNKVMLRKSTAIAPIQWGKLPLGGAIAIFSLAVFISTTMVLMGYIRSSVRLDWHVTEVLKDTTPWAGTPTLSYAIGMVMLNVLLFWIITALIFRSGRSRRRSTFTRQAEGLTTEAKAKDLPSELIPK
ncbi:MAG: cytochrome ubiquinol oxidase subunit I [Nitrospiria bacterium]